MVGRLRLEASGRPVHVLANERGIVVHVEHPLRLLGSISSIRRSWRAIADVPRAGEVQARLAASAPPLAVRLGPLPPIRLHPDPGAVGRWMLGRL